MAARVLFLNTLRDGVDPGEYEDWVRRVDYPVARRQPAIRSYDVTRLDGLPDADGAPPFHYLEVLEVTSVAEYRDSLDGNPELEPLLAEWSRYVASSTIVHGEVL